MSVHDERTETRQATSRNSHIILFTTCSEKKDKKRKILDVKNCLKNRDISR